MTNKKVVSFEEKREEFQFNGNFTKISISDKGIPFIAYNAAIVNVQKK